MGAAFAERRFSGAVLTAVSARGTSITRTYGFADAARGTPIDADTSLFTLGSITKTLVATAVCALIEQRRIGSLDDPVNRYLKRVRLADAQSGPLTIRNLLTHSAGFDGGTAGFAAPQPSNILVSSAEIHRFIPALVRPVNSEVSYSNFGFGLLGIMLEDISGQPLPRFMREQVFRPLGMLHAQIVAGDDLPATLVWPAVIDTAGRVRMLERLRLTTFMAGAGGAVASSADMARYLRFLLQTTAGASAPILRAPDSAALFRPERTNHPVVSSVGLAWWIRDWNGVRYYEHTGSWPHHLSTLTLLPSLGVGVFISVVGEAGSGAKPISAEQLRSRLLKALLGPIPDSTTRGAVDLTPYTGTYRDSRRAQRTMEAVGDLLSPNVIDVKGDGHGELRIAGEPGYVATAPGVFRLRHVPDEITDEALVAFTPDTSGRAVRLSDARGSSAFERVFWWNDPRVQGRLLLMLTLVLSTGMATIRWKLDTPSGWLTRITPTMMFVGAVGGEVVLSSGYGGGGFQTYVLLGRQFRFIAAAGFSWLLLLASLATLMTFIRFAGPLAPTASRAVARRVHLALLIASGIGIACIAAVYNVLTVRLPY